MSRQSLGPDFDLGTDQLFGNVLSTWDDDEANLGSLVALHGRPTEAVIQRCIALCGSSEIADRTTALRVLRELRHELVDSDLVWARVRGEVLALAEHDPEASVRRWAVSCLGYQAVGGEELSLVLSLVADPDPGVRFAVAAALPLMVVDPEDPDEAVLDALVGLTADESGNVRAYALMGLGDDLHVVERFRSVFEEHRSDEDDQIRRYVQTALAAQDRTAKGKTRPGG